MLISDEGSTGAPGDTSGVQVTCRLRGPLLTENIDDWQPAIQQDPTNTSSISVFASPRAFTFDHVFPSGSTQHEVFQRIGVPCVRDFLLGFNCTMLAYGQTGSGKTFTIVGDTGEQAGLLPRMLEMLFASVNEDVSLSASFVEVYQERLRDLLVVSSQPNLRLREEKGDGKTPGSIWIDGATEISLLNLATARATLSRGLAQRAVGETTMNRDSSRSHAVFAVTMVRRSAGGGRVRSRLCVVDLAGSEQAKRTNATGRRLEEAKYINRSLSALGNVIHSLTDSKKSSFHVPYRDSKLTRLLQTSLGGNTKTHLLLTCATTTCHVDETLSTLRFGARAKRMKNQPIVNLTTRKGDATGELLQTLQNKIDTLCRYVRELEDAAELKAACCRCQPSAHREAKPELEVVDDNDVDDVYSPGCEKASGAWAISKDVIMQAELTVLRNALREMENHKEHEQLHASTLRESVERVAAEEAEKIHERQARELQRLSMQLDEAEAEISSLQQQLRSVRDEEADLREKLQHQHKDQRRDTDLANAEAEILRRQLEHSDLVLKSLKLELAASQAEVSGLRGVVERVELHLAKLVKENESLQRHIQSLEARMSDNSPASASKCELRPMAIEIDSTTARPGTNSMAIRSWWSGDSNNLGENPTNELIRVGDETAWRGKHRKCRLDTAPPPSCDFSSSGGIKPFRTRLVSLLTTLEAETTSCKVLLSGGCEDMPLEMQQRPSAAISRARKHRLRDLAPLSADRERETDRS